MRIGKKYTKMEKLNIDSKEGSGSANGMLPDINIFNLPVKGNRLYRNFIAIAEKPLMEKILNVTKGNKSEAAKILGINRNTLDTKLKYLNIDAKKFK